MSVFEIENGDPCLQSLLSSKDFKPLLDNYNCDDADSYDNGDNDRALDQLMNTFVFYGIAGINRIFSPSGLYLGPV